MKVLNINSSDILGGAAKAAYRLHKGLQLVGADSQMLVQSKSSDDFTVLGGKTKLEKGLGKVKPTLETLPHNLYRKREKTIFSTQWLPSNIHTQINQLNPDVVNLHWICGSFVSIQTIAKINKPIIWTLHDMWAFTGGCHYGGNCEGYLKNCGNCPQLHSNQSWDLSRWIWQRKSKAWHSLNLMIVTPSRWLADCAKKSSLFEGYRVEVIANGLDVSLYKPIDKKFARNLLNLPQHKKLILFGAMSATSDKRKGFQFLIPALEKLALQKKAKDFELVVFGASQPAQDHNLPFKINYLGRLNDDITLALTYNSADVMIVPSIQEAFGQTASESLACGTPVVSFDSTGLKDIVDHHVNGYRAKCFSPEDLAQGIIWVLENDERWQTLSKNARKTVEEKFTLQLQVQKYLQVYREAINQYEKQI